MSGPGVYKMGTFSRLTGFSPAVLRAWERRHALLEPERLDGGHRLYTEEDLRVLARVKELLEEGRSIGEIAKLGRPQLLRRAASMARSPAMDVAAGDRIERLRERLVAAARDIDAVGLQHTLDDAFGALSPARVVDDVLGPALITIGDLWHRGEVSVAGEHLVSTELLFHLHKLIEVTRSGDPDHRPVVLACLPEEQHVLGLLMLTFHLATRGVRVIFLGTALPFPDLQRACEKLAPSAICLSVTSRDLLDAHCGGLVELARRYGSQIDFHVGGQGVAGPPEPGLVAAGVELWPPRRDPADLISQLAS